MHMGLLDMTTFPPNGYAPATFGMSDDEHLRLVSPAALGQPIFVEWDRATSPSGMKCPPAEVAV